MKSQSSFDSNEDKYTSDPVVEDIGNRRNKTTVRNTTLGTIRLEASAILVSLFLTGNQSKQAVVTGANSGLGKATALALVQRGISGLIVTCRKPVHLLTNQCQSYHHHWWHLLLFVEHLFYVLIHSFLVLDQLLLF